MSVNIVKEEVRRFLQGKDAEVLCIMGKWGVGKTFAWNQYLRASVDDGSVTPKQYSYVSLFGQNSLESLRYSIFENTVALGQTETGANPMSFEALARKAIGYIGVLPWVKDNLSPLIARSYFLTVRDQIICIDDLERVGDGLSTKDILGLVSFLKEQRRCKVVLLLNDEELKEEAADSFKSQLEKVIDVEMHFDPTPLEAATIGIDTGTSFHEKFAATSIALGIVNIRVIRKIERLIKRLAELLEGHDSRILDATIPAIVLFGWITYQPNLAPPEDFVTGYHRFADLLRNAPQETEKEKAWRVLLNSIEYSHFDELDKLLLESIKKGYFDPETVEKMAKKLDKDWAAHDQDSSFSQAWEKYHGSFKCDADEVLDAMFAAFKAGVGAITPLNADSTIIFFREFGRDTEADEMVAYYIAERKEDKAFYDPRESVFLTVKDPAFAKAFADKLASFKDARTPKDILMNIAKNSGWNPEDITTLAAVSADEFFALFKELEGSDLRVIVSTALKFRQYSNADAGMLQIAINAETALKKIAAECDINRRRVLSYGITLDASGEESAT